MNLQTAVLMQVQEFVNSGQTFSRYDITKALRQKCNDGLMEIPDIEDTNPGASNRFNVRKDAVDGIFEQLYQNCLVNGLPPLTYNYEPTLGYRVFSVDPNAAPVPAPPVASATNARNVGGPWGVPTPTILVKVDPTQITSVPIPSPRTATLGDPEIRRRIDLYLSRCAKIGMTPTLKNIQSAIKRGNKSTGLSYREIVNVASSLGYKV